MLVSNLPYIFWVFASWIVNLSRRVKDLFSEFWSKEKLRTFYHIPLLFLHFLLFAFMRSIYVSWLIIEYWIQFCLLQQQERDVTNLYIANLPLHVTENDLESMFNPYGKVISTRILRDQSAISRGVGFARMESKEKCEAVIQAFNGKLLPRKFNFLK